MEEIKKHLTDTICSVRKGSMDDNQFRATVEHNLDLMKEYAVSKERERIVERVMKDAEEKHSGHEDWEYGDCDCDSLYDYKDVINLINTK